MSGSERNPRIPRTDRPHSLLGDVETRLATLLDNLGPATRDETAPPTESIALTTAHRTILAADIDGFGAYSRNNTNQVRLRRGLYGALRYALDAAGVPWHSCRREDRGDGLLMLAAADVPKSAFADRVPGALVEALVRHNRTHPVEERIRLRLVLHAGEVTYDDHGVTSSSITHTFRLLEANTVRATLTESSAVLAVVGSAWFYDEVIRHSEWSEARSYRRTTVATKETSAEAWIRLLGRYWP